MRGTRLSEEEPYTLRQARIGLATVQMEGHGGPVYMTQTRIKDFTGLDRRHPDGIGVPSGVDLGRGGGKGVAWSVSGGQSEQGIDVLIHHHRLVQTGLDLIDFS